MLELSFQGTALDRRLHRFASQRQRLAILPVAQSEHAQLGRGPSDLYALNAFGRDVIVSRSFTGPRRASYLVFEPDWVLLKLPLSWTGDLILNGRRAESRELMLSANTDGYYLVGENRTLLNVAMRRTCLMETLRALAGRPDDEVVLEDLHVRLDHGTWTTLRTGLDAAIDACNWAMSRDGRATLPDAVEDVVTCIVADALMPHLLLRPEARALAGPLEVVRAAQRAYEELPPERVTLATLCRYAGVGKVWLHKCFVQVYGMSPMTYQRARRLTEARLRLVRSEAPPPSVKDVALSLGFLKPGRFAADYKKIFGELPSETLERAAAA